MSPTQDYTHLLAGLADITDDKERLLFLASAVTDLESVLTAAREERLSTAFRLREAGEAMIDIAKWAGVSDSYLTRQALGRGAKRRSSRRAAWR